LQPPRDTWMGMHEADGAGNPPMWLHSTPQTPSEKRGRPLAAGAVRMVGNLPASLAPAAPLPAFPASQGPRTSTAGGGASPRGAPASRGGLSSAAASDGGRRASTATPAVRGPSSSVLTATTAEVLSEVVVLGAGISVGVGRSDLSVRDLPHVVATSLAKVGYGDVEASVLGDHLHVRALSLPQQLSATLRRQRHQDGPFESAVDTASGTVLPGTTLVFTSGESVDLGVDSLPISELPRTVKQRLSSVGYTDVGVQVDLDSGTVRAVGRSDLSLYASLSSLPLAGSGGGAGGGGRPPPPRGGRGGGGGGGAAAAAAAAAVAVAAAGARLQPTASSL
jgi:hypothetical protein